MGVPRASKPWNVNHSISLLLCELYHCYCIICIIVVVCLLLFNGPNFVFLGPAFLFLQSCLLKFWSTCVSGVHTYMRRITVDVELMDDKTLNFLDEGFQRSIADHISSVLLVFNFTMRPSGVYRRPCPKSMTCHIWPILESLPYLGASRDETVPWNCGRKMRPHISDEDIFLLFPTQFQILHNIDAHLACHGENERDSKMLS